ncbi:MAG: hypothetical protein HFH31_04050 [Bacilli bacterium]|nr:hypothetical protein [Bacilli bacterium]
MTKYYSIIKEPKNSKIEIDYNKLNGFRLMPKNQVEYDGIMVNKLVLINQSFIERVLKKKIKRKLDLYLNLIIETLGQESDDESGESIRQALNDLSRYRDVIEYKYQKYLDEKYIALLLQKIAILEYELKQKFVSMMNYQEVEKEEHSKSGRSR